MAASVEQFQTIHTEGAILPPDVLQRIAAGELDGLDPATYHLPTGTKTKEAISQSWTRLLRYWKDFQAARKLILPSDETGALATREKWLLPLFQELGYGRLTTTKAPEIDGKLFPVERFWQHIPIHLIGCKLDLDHRTKGARGAATAIPHSMVQEFLNRSDEHAWAFLSNGLQLRLLRDSAALSRQSYVEFDLESMMEGEVYSDFAVLWLVCHQSRLEGDKPEDFWLEKWSKFAQEQGTRILEDLRVGVQKAIEALGRGFISHPRNEALIVRLQSGALTKEDYYRQILRIVYRLLFLFVAEDRGLLHPPAPTDEALRTKHQAACDWYDRFYSLRRLRDLAETYRGSKHTDLWHSLSLLIDALGKSEGCPQLALSALGSFLWSHAAAPDLSGPAQLGVASTNAPAFIRNEDLLDAVRALAFVERNRVLRAVNYRNLGSVELGSVYESLLELHPQINIPGRSFALNVAAGNERKITGSFYTPDSLVQCLLDSALEPVVAEAIKGKNGVEAEKAILNIKVCDPAVGSGHFLIASAHRLARHLARVRTGESEPSPQDYQRALRDVIGHCLYGVDLNPMAVELCKVSLWMEALEPGKPLNFLDHRIQVGNSLIGATPALLARSIPDEAFEPIEGDDKAYCREFKKQNKDERKGQGLLFDRDSKPWLHLGNLAASVISRLDALPDDALGDIRSREQQYAELVNSSTYESGRFLADAWCTAFVFTKTKELDYPITDKIFRDIERNPHSVPPWMKAEIMRHRDQLQFFHWHLAFPDVFTPRLEIEQDDVTGWDGGFDVVLGNPPWERMNLEARQFFATSRPDIAAASTARRRTLIASLREEDPVLHAAFLSAQRAATNEIAIAQRCGRYCFLNQARLNTYVLFAETSLRIVNAAGRVGIIVPSGIATDDTCRPLFNWLISSRRLRSLYDFENRLGIFPDVDSRYKFCLFTSSGNSSPADTSPQFAFFLHAIEDMYAHGRTFTLDQAELDTLAPATGLCPTFRSGRDKAIVLTVQRRIQPFIKQQQCGSEWVESDYLIMFRSDDSAESYREACEVADTQPDPDHSQLITHGGLTFVPVWESKLMHQFDHRFATYAGVADDDRRAAKPRELTSLEKGKHFSAVPRAWIAESDVLKLLDRREYARRWTAGYRDITNATNERTAIASIIPWGGTAQPLNSFLPESAEHALFWVSGFNSFIVDFVARQTIGGVHLNITTARQLPILGPNSTPPNFKPHVLNCALELTYTSGAMEQFASECGLTGRPFMWDEERRFRVRCELDALYFQLYGIARDDVDYIMDTFPIVKRKDEQKFNGDYRTKRAILEIYDAMAEATKAGQPYQTRLDPPPAGPRVAHPAKPPTTAQVQRGRVVAYLTLLLHAWKKPVSRDALEPSLIFMLNDKLRSAALEQQSAPHASARTASGEIVKGLDGLLAALHANGAMVVENVNSRQTIRLGANAAAIDSAPQADRQRAEEAVRATGALGEDRAMTYLDGIGEARYDVVHA